MTQNNKFPVANFQTSFIGCQEYNFWAEGFPLLFKRHLNRQRPLFSLLWIDTTVFCNWCYLGFHFIFLCFYFSLNVFYPYTFFLCLVHSLNLHMLPQCTHTHLFFLFFENQYMQWLLWKPSLMSWSWVIASPPVWYRKYTQCPSWNRTPKNVSFFLTFFHVYL